MPSLERPHKLNGAHALLSGTAQLLNGARLLSLCNPINTGIAAGVVALLLLTSAVVPAQSRTHHKSSTSQHTTSAVTTSSKTHKRSAASSTSTSTSSRSSRSSRGSHSTVSAASGTRSSHRHGAQSTVVASSKRGRHSASSWHQATPSTTAHARSSGHPEHVVAKHSTAPAEPIAEPGEYSSQSKIYTLYDQGLNARLVGDYHTSVSRLEELAPDDQGGSSEPYHGRHESI